MKIGPLALLLIGLCASAQTGVQASDSLPTGGSVAAGSASIQQSGARMDIQQNSDKAILNWQSFNIGSNAQVNFRQPSASSVALNRVLGADPSAIHGQLNANGQVFLLNPNGVLFGKGARVDVGGLVTSTRQMSDADFMAGNYRFSGGSQAAIENQGSILARNGAVVFKAAAPAQWDQTIQAGAGAGMLVSENGVLKLVRNSGSITARNVELDAGAQGMSSVAGQIVVSNAQGSGGRIAVTGQEVAVLAGSTLDARGSTGGGQIHIGGEWQGGGNTPQATWARVESGAVLDASATETGNGGEIVVWSNVQDKASVTRAQGELRARGGSQSGHGGRIETSGASVDIAGIRVDAGAGADKGQGGAWLIDPFDYTIGSAEATTIAETLGTGTTVTVDTVVNNASYGSNGDSGGSGNITVSSPITSSGSGGLNLKATNAIILNGAISIGGKVDLNTANGNINLNANITTADSTDQAIVLNAGSVKNAGDATGGNIIANASASVGTGVNGRATLYSGSTSDASLMGLVGYGSGHFRYNSDETDANYSKWVSP